MRDSRIGTYGVCALALSILLRVSALASLADPALVVPALIAAHAAARAVMPAFMLFVPPARRDGLSFAAGRPPGGSAAAAAVLGFSSPRSASVRHAPVGGDFARSSVVALMARLSLRQIGGQTGDTLGALEQAGEIVGFAGRGAVIAL